MKSSCSVRSVSRLKFVLCGLLLTLLAAPAFAVSWQDPVKFTETYARQVEVAQNLDGTLVAFFVQMDRTVAYRRQLKANSREWSDRINLGIYANNIKVGRNQDGRLEVFAIGTMANVLSHIMQSAPNSDSWSSEMDIDDLYATQIEVAAAQDGSLILFVVQPNRKMAYIRQSAPNQNTWTGPTSLGEYANDIAVGRHRDGRLELFYIGTLGNVLYRMSQIGPNSDKWSGEKEIEGVYGREIAAINNQDGTLSLFVVEMSREVAYVQQTSANSDAFGPRTSLGIYANRVGLGPTRTGAIEVVAVGTLGNVLSHVTQAAPNSREWTEEADMRGYAAQISLANHEDGRLELCFVAPLANQLYHATEAP